MLPPMQPAARRCRAAAAKCEAPRRMQGEISVGGQEQFYLEGQISYVAPKRRRLLPPVVLDPAPDRDAAGGRACARHRFQPGRRRNAAHGWRLRRQGIAVGDFRLHRRGRRAYKLRPAGQAAPRPRRRHDDYRQAPRLRFRLRRRLRRRRADPGGVHRNGRAGRVFRRPDRAGGDARGVPLRQCLFISATSASTPTASRPIPSRTPRSAASADRRARSRSNTFSTISRASLGCDPLEVRKRNFYGGTSAIRHALRPNRAGQRHPRAGRRARGPSSDYRRSGARPSPNSIVRARCCARASR